VSGSEGHVSLLPAAARAALEAGDDGAETIARPSGFGTAETMRRSFLRELGIPPSACRARFARSGPGPGGSPDR
jgi:transcriptional regulator GlxA family with amidase domain